MAAKTVKHSAKFVSLQERYNRGGCTKEQLKRFVGFGVITAEEYTEITGEDYSNVNPRSDGKTKGNN